MSDDIEQRCAQRLGMKPSEIIEVQESAGGVLVRTHCGTWTLIRADGALEYGVAAPRPPAPAAAPVADPQPEASEPEPRTEKPAPKRRSRA